MKTFPIIYNCGYYSAMTMNGPSTKKRYKFRKKLVTFVEKPDYQPFLDMTSKDVAWCPINDKSLKPFMSAEDWCAGKEGRFDAKPFKIYDPKKYCEFMKA